MTMEDETTNRKIKKAGMRMAADGLHKRLEEINICLYFFGIVPAWVTLIFQGLFLCLVLLK